MAYIEGTDRRQNILFPSSVDEYVDELNPVRVIAAFIGALDFKELGFVRAAAAETGRPGYDPRLLMGLYIWGHMNKVRSSRKLEKECGRNLEVMWLMEGLRPDFKTIADFRKDNSEPIKGVVVKFRLWCLAEELYGRELVALDGSKFKADNNSERNFTQKKLKKVIARERGYVEKYLQQIEAADQEEQEQQEQQLSKEEWRAKMDRMKERLGRNEKLLQEMIESGVSQVSLTDEDARLMKTAKGCDVCYNVQAVVDSKHKLIAEYEVTNDGNDMGQLAKMGEKAKQALAISELTLLADGGYFEGNTVKECEEAGITTYLPIPKSGMPEKHGVFAVDQFTYDEARDLYVCPQGEELTSSHKEVKNNKEYKIYRTQACVLCPLRPQCTTSKKGRKIRRWVSEAVVERLRERIRGQPDLLRERKKLAEHPFGTIKRAMDQGYFLLRGMKKVTTEISLTVLSYNMKRAINIMGVEKMVHSLQEVI